MRGAGPYVASIAALAAGGFAVYGHWLPGLYLADAGYVAGLRCLGSVSCSVDDAGFIEATVAAIPVVPVGSCPDGGVLSGYSDAGLTCVVPQAVGPGACNAGYYMAEVALGVPPTCERINLPTAECNQVGDSVKWNKDAGTWACESIGSWTNCAHIPYDAGGPAFVNADAGGWAPLGYRVDGKRVCFRGTTCGGALGNKACELPAPYRPAYKMHLALESEHNHGPVGTTVHGGVEVSTDGVVVPVEGEDDWYMDGVCFEYGN